MRSDLHRTASTGVEILRCASSGTLMLPVEYAMLQDASLRFWVEKFATDPAKFSAEFALAWAKLQELGCSELQPHPSSLTYASGCYLPNEWLKLPLVPGV